MTCRGDTAAGSEGRSAEPVEAAVLRQHHSHLPLHVLRNPDKAGLPGPPQPSATLPKLTDVLLLPGTCCLLFEGGTS